MCRKKIIIIYNRGIVIPVVFLNNVALFPCKNKNRSTKRSHKYSDFREYFIDMPSSFSHILSKPTPRTPKRIVLKSLKTLTTNIDKNRVCRLIKAKQICPLLWPHRMIMKSEFILSSLSLSSDVKSGGLSLPQLFIPPVNSVLPCLVIISNTWIEFPHCYVFFFMGGIIYSQYVYVNTYIYIHNLYMIHSSKISITPNQIA